MIESGPTIVIIGAGFSGTAVAAHVLRRRLPVRVVLVNRFGPMGRGVAYGTRHEAHVLNVPAAQMSAFPDEPDHFLRHAQARDTQLHGQSFVSRRLYGEYLEHVLREATEGAVEGARLQTVVGEVASLDELDDGSGVEATLAPSRAETREAGPAVPSRTEGPRILRADYVVLALGNYAPANLPVEDGGFHATERYVRDPWAKGALDVIAPGDRVLLVGTGLTMIDIALDLGQRGAGAPLHAVSRHGLVPHPHPKAIRRGGGPPEMTDLDAPGPARIARYVRALRAHVRAHQAGGGDWREVVGALRAMTPRLWQALSTAERARFLRHVRPYWDVHRHRAAPETASAVGAMVAGGRLRIHAGRIVAYEDGGRDGVSVVVRPRGATRRVRIRVDRVVNCTGPDSDVRRLDDALLRSLGVKGAIRADGLGLGLETAENGALLDAQGHPSRRLFLVGPLLKARFWESTAVPELREHAARLARELLPDPASASFAVR